MIYKDDQMFYDLAHVVSIIKRDYDVEFTFSNNQKVWIRFDKEALKNIEIVDMWKFIFTLIVRRQNGLMAISNGQFKKMWEEF